MDNNISLEGFIDIDIVDANTGKLREHIKGHNTISDAGLKAFLVEAIGISLQNNRCILGNNLNYSLGYTYYGSSSYLASYNFNNGVIGPLLLNLPGSPEFNFSNGESVVYYMNNQLEPDFGGKVVGYGLNNVNPSADNMEGAIESINGQTLVDNFTIANRWIFREGVANGTINAICLCLLNKNKKSLLLKNGKNYQDVIFGGSPAPVVANKVIPGDFGEIASNSFWLNYTSNGLRGYIYNTETGELTNQDFTNGLSIRDVTSYQYSTYVDTEYIYTIEHNVSSVNTINVYDINSNIATIYLPQYIYYSYCGFLNVGGDLYVVACGNIKSDNESISYVLYKMNKGSYAYYSSVSNTSTTYEALGFTIPNDTNYLITSERFDDGGYYNVSNITYTGIRQMPNKSITYKFINNSNIVGSITGVGYNTGLKLLGGSSPYRIEYNPYLTYNTSEIVDTIGSSNVPNNYSNIDIINGLGNAYSCYLLNQPIEKLDTDILHLTYGFKVSNI